MRFSCRAATAHRSAFAAFFIRRGARVREIFRASWENLRKPRRSERCPGRIEKGFLDRFVAIGLRGLITP
jgi:hypothetical protein